MKTEKVITNFAVKFLTEHWEEINLKAVHISEPKQTIINRTKKDYDFAIWVITEVMVWGTKTDYLKSYEQANEDDDLIIKIDERYFLFEFRPDRFTEVFPKFKQVLYFSTIK